MRTLHEIREDYENATEEVRNPKLSEKERARSQDQVVALRHEMDGMVADLLETREHEYQVGGVPVEKARALAAGSAKAKNRFWMPTIHEYNTVRAASLAGGADATGGVFVPLEQASVFFDMIRAQSVVLAAGPRMVDMNSDTLNVPKIASSTSVAFYAENAAITSTEATTEAVALTARKLAAFALLSNEILADSNPSIREVISYDFAQAMAAALDDAFLEGNGVAPNISGIRNWSGTTTTAVATNGGPITLSLITNAIGRHMIAGADVATSAFFCHPRTWATVKAMADAGGQYYLHQNITDPAVNRLFGIPVYVSTQISVTETEGTSGAVCSWLGLVDMKQVVVGRRQELSIKFSEDYSFNTDSTAIRATSRWDFQPIEAAAVQIIDGITS